LGRHDAKKKKANSRTEKGHVKKKRKKKLERQK
jgi:hypothetical protein